MLSRRPRAYPELFALVGESVPDYRGLFLRGHGSQASTHYGVVTHQSGGLGQLQGDSIRNITGQFGGHALGWYGGFGSGPFYSYSSGDRGSAGNGIGTSWGFDVSRATPTAQEIRPVNRAVRYLIRALP